jgi:hypothetical protein
VPEVKGNGLAFLSGKEDKFDRGRNCHTCVAGTKRNRFMETIYFLIWLAGGGLATYVGFRLLKSAERHDDLEDERLWQDLLHPGTP